MNGGIAARVWRGVMGAAVLSALWTVPSVASAQVPTTMIHQGRLLDRAGAGVAGSQSLVYRIYDSATGGTAIWTETLTVTLDDGYFSTQLGSTTPLTPAVFAGRTRFLGVTVGTDPEMTPREPIGSVPFALVAGNVTGDITPTSITVGGTQIVDSTGRWVGASSGPSGPAGPAGPLGPAGVPRVDLGQDMRTYFDHHHTANDTPAVLDERALDQAVAVWTAAVGAMASMRESFGRAPVEAR